LLKHSLFGFCLACILCLLTFDAGAQTGGVEILNLKADRLDKNIAVSAQIKFELPSAIENAMYKGVSLTFVSEVEITRERWYWIDKTVAKARRQIRVSFQALTRRWRVLPWSEGTGAAGLGVQLPQTYDTLAEALAQAQNIHNWRVAESADIGDADYWLVMRYRLDTSQLPQPLQIGLLGQGEWIINATMRQHIRLAEEKP